MDELNKIVDFNIPKIKLPEIPKINLPEMNPIPTINRDFLNVNTAEMVAVLAEMEEDRERMEAKKEAYDQEVLHTLKNIEANTKGLDSVVSLLVNIKEQQEDVLELLKEILAISASPSLEVAESKYRQIMNKVNSGIEDFSTMQTLMGFANTIFQMYKGTLG